MVVKCVSLLVNVGAALTWVVSALLIVQLTTLRPTTQWMWVTLLDRRSDLIQWWSFISFRLLLVKYTKRTSCVALILVKICVSLTMLV